MSKLKRSWLFTPHHGFAPIKFVSILRGFVGIASELTSTFQVQFAFAYLRTQIRNKLQTPSEPEIATRFSTAIASYELARSTLLFQFRPRISLRSSWNRSKLSGQQSPFYIKVGLCSCCAVIELKRSGTIIYLVTNVSNFMQNSVLLHAQEVESRVLHVSKF